jgi:hypothetical protein
MHGGHYPYGGSSAAAAAAAASGSGNSYWLINLYIVRISFKSFRLHLIYSACIYHHLFDSSISCSCILVNFYFLHGCCCRIPYFWLLI